MENENVTPKTQDFSWVGTADVPVSNEATGTIVGIMTINCRNSISAVNPETGEIGKVNAIVPKRQITCRIDGYQNLVRFLLPSDTVVPTIGVRGKLSVNAKTIGDKVYPTLQAFEPLS